MPQAEIEIPKHYQPTFERNMVHANQQKYSKLIGLVDVGPASGEGVSPVDLFEDTEAQEANDRKGDSPDMELGRSRRWVTPRKWEWGTLVDGMDVLKQVLDPTSELVTAARMAMDRYLDRQIIMPAFFGNVLQGKDMTDAIGGTQAVYDTTKYDVPVTVGSAGGATPVGMNVDKLIEVKRRFIAEEVDVSGERLNIGLCSTQWANLFGDVRATSGDYVNQRPISKGDHEMLMNMNYVLIEKLPIDTATNRRFNPVWVKRGIKLRTWMDTKVNIGPDASKKFRPRVYIERAAGACRAQEGLVMKVISQE